MTANPLLSSIATPRAQAAIPVPRLPLSKIINPHHTPPTYQAKDERDPERQITKYECQLAIYTGDLAYFTKWLVYATSGLIVIGLLQGYFLQKSVRVADRAAIEARDAITAAQTSANAAMLHAKAAVNTEMPIVRLDLIQVRDHKTGATIADGLLTGHFDINIWFKNFGRTPAFPYRVITGHQFSPEIPSDPVYPFIAELDPGAVIPANGGTFIAPPQSIYVQNSETILRRAQDLEIYFWFYQMIEFRDVLENKNTWRYCVRWLPFVGQPPEGGYAEALSMMAPEPIDSSPHRMAARQSARTVCPSYLYGPAPTQVRIADRLGSRFVVPVC